MEILSPSTCDFQGHFPATIQQAQRGRQRAWKLMERFFSSSLIARPKEEMYITFTLIPLTRLSHMTTPVAEEAGKCSPTCISRKIGVVNISQSLSQGPSQNIKLDLQIHPALQQLRMWI